MRAVWKKIRYRLEWLALKSAAGIVPLLSRKACYRLALVIGAMAATLDRAGRRVALSNLQVAYSGELSPARRAEIVRESYQHFARTMIDLFWSPRLTRENYSRYIDVEGLDLWQEEIRPGNPVIFACCHYSNFEWIANAANYFGVESALVTQEFKNPLLNPIFVSLRECSGQRVIHRGGAVLQLYKTLHRGGRVAILTDLTIPAQLPTVAIDCFGLKTSVTFAHAWAHRRAGATVINVHSEPLPDGRYRIVFHPRIEFPPEASFREIAQACWDQFEPYVRANPAPWLWMYKHWRYRPIAADPAAYPPYANVSQDFERRLEERAKNLPPMSSTLTLDLTPDGTFQRSATIDKSPPMRFSSD
ncbi:MAG TPA: lysophospholipid acyltransferase family protein [Chthoniobacterales bacterium]|nr:lysophospholipid acyltransferase family protein [Chthoniobacterales bacterium]